MEAFEVKQVTLKLLATRRDMTELHENGASVARESPVKLQFISHSSNNSVGSTPASSFQSSSSNSDGSGGSSTMTASLSRAYIVVEVTRDGISAVLVPIALAL